LQCDNPMRVRAKQGTEAIKHLVDGN